MDTRFLSSSVAPNGIRRLRALPVELATSFKVVREIFRSEEMLGDPEYQEALKHLLLTVPKVARGRVSQAIESFSPIGRVLLLAVFQSAYEGGRLDRVLDLFEHQMVLHWSRCPSATRGQALVEKDARYLRELCVYSGFPIPAQLHRVA